MKFFLDFFPLLVFVGVYSYSGAEHPMYPAVQGLMVASVIQTIGTRLFTGKFEKLHLWLLVVTLVLGTLTLVFRNPDFLFWKASVVVWITAAVFLYTQFITKKPLIQKMMEPILEDVVVPDSVWFPINLSWPIFNILFGFLNLYIAFNFTEAFWVKFKLFGLLGMTLCLVGFSLYKLFPYIPMEEEEEIKQVNEED
jgi:intracellular septation protein